MKFVHARKKSYKLEKPSVAALEYVRRSVPSTHKYFDNEGAGTWYIDLKYTVPVGQVQLSSQANLDYSELPEFERKKLDEYSRKASPTQLNVNATDSYSILHLLPSAPRVIVDAAWKALAREHHPDRGGNTEVFQKYQAAYDHITKGR